MRKKNRLRLKAELETILTTKLVEEWVEELNKISVPAGPVLSIPEVLNHPQITKRGILTTLENIPGVEKSIDVLKAAQIVSEEGIGFPVLLGDVDIINELRQEIEFDDHSIADKIVYIAHGKEVAHDA